MKRFLKKLLKIIAVIVILFIILLCGLVIIIYWPEPYKCHGYDDNMIDIEACYYKQLNRAADENNMEQRINFMDELSEYYGYYYNEEVSKEFLEATYALCKYANKVPKEPDRSLCSRIRSELGGPSLPISEENKKAIEEYMAREKASSKK